MCIQVFGLTHFSSVPAPFDRGDTERVLQNHVAAMRECFTSRIAVSLRLQRLMGRVEIIRSLRATDARRTSRRLLLWEFHIRVLRNHASRHGGLMIP